VAHARTTMSTPPEPSVEARLAVLATELANQRTEFAKQHTEQRKEIAELRRSYEERNKKFAEQDKMFAEQDRQIAELRHALSFQTHALATRQLVVTVRDWLAWCAAGFAPDWTPGTQLSGDAARAMETAFNWLRAAITAGKEVPRLPLAQPLPTSPKATPRASQSPPRRSKATVAAAALTAAAAHSGVFDYSTFVGVLTAVSGRGNAVAHPHLHILTDDDLLALLDSVRDTVTSLGPSAPSATLSPRALLTLYRHVCPPNGAATEADVTRVRRALLLESPSAVASSQPGVAASARAPAAAASGSAAVVPPLRGVRGPSTPAHAVAKTAAHTAGSAGSSGAACGTASIVKAASAAAPSPSISGSATGTARTDLTAGVDDASAAAATAKAAPSAGESAARLAANASVPRAATSPAAGVGSGGARTAWAGKPATQHLS
jgi:hypothetical protein